MAKFTKNNELDFVVTIDKYDQEQQVFKKHLYEFAYTEKDLVNKHYNAIIDFAKFNIIPEINKETLRMFCGSDISRVDRSDADIDDTNFIPEICVLVLKNSTKLVKLSRKSI